MKTSDLPSPARPARLFGRLHSPADLETAIREAVDACGATVTRDETAGTVTVTAPGGAEMLRAIRKGEPGEPSIVIYDRAFYAPIGESGEPSKIASRTETRADGKKALVQTFGPYEVRRYPAKVDGSRPAGFALFTAGSDRGRFVPYGIAALAAGRDRWMRDLVGVCTCCRRGFRVGDPEATNGEICPACTAEAEAENAAANA